MNYIFENQECSSGCESGWTLYLDHSSISPSNDQERDLVAKSRNRSFGKTRFVKDEGYQEEEETEGEDLSMVSDASSGPPHFHDQEEGYYGNNTLYHNSIDASASSSRNRRKMKENRGTKVKDHSVLDDTASSPLFGHSNKNFNFDRRQPTKKGAMEEYSQGYSTTQFEATSRYNEHCDFFDSSISGNQLQQNQLFEGKRW